MQTALVTVPFRPSTPFTGEESLCILRGKNLKLRGLAPNMYFEAYSGSKNLNEPIPTVALTGTLAFDPTSQIVTGSGTSFLDELHQAQSMIQANAEVLVVEQVFSDTSFKTNRPPITTETAVTGYRLPQLFPLDINRASQLTGNAVHFDRGTILSVGSGTLYVNGQVLAGESLVASRRAQVALYDSATQTYDVQDIGFNTVPTFVYGNITVVNSGGTKNMSLGYYSFRVAYYSTITSGYGNATDTLLSGGTEGFQITAVNSTFDFDFSADVPPAKASGYIIYGSAFAGSSDISKVNAIQGGWFQIGDPIPFTSLTAGHYIFDYVDTDLSILVSFDNDLPPDAEFYGTLDRYPVLISTNGAGVGNGDRKTSTNPGPFISPIKAENFDAYPNTYKVPTEKGETIIGTVSAAGRIFVLTSNTLQAVTPTGLPSAPFTCRPFWHRGFQGYKNLAFVNDTLYGFTTAGMFRSIATGDEGSEADTFSASVQAQTAKWHGGYVFIDHDPKNNEMCFFYSAVRQNAQGYWETDIYPYSLTQEDWHLPIVLSDPTRDMIVSGTATVAGHLEFIAGGRRQGTSNQMDTWRYDASDGTEAVPWNLAFNYMDSGSELISKYLHKLRPKGKFTDAKVQIYTVKPDSNIDVTDLDTGANPDYEYNLDDSAIVHQYAVNKCRIRNALMWTARMEGTSTWSGDLDDEKDQFHELVVDYSIAGQER